MALSARTDLFRERSDADYVVKSTNDCSIFSEFLRAVGGSVVTVGSDWHVFERMCSEFSFLDVGKCFQGGEWSVISERFLRRQLGLSHTETEVKEVLVDMDDSNPPNGIISRLRDERQGSGSPFKGDRVCIKTRYKGLDCLLVDLQDERIRPTGYAVWGDVDWAYLRTWKLEVSNDGAHWKTIDAQTDHPLVYERRPGTIRWCMDEDQGNGEGKRPVYRFPLESSHDRWRMLRLRGVYAHNASFEVFGYISSIQEE